MKGFRDWVLSQIVSKSLVSPTPLSGGNGFYEEERPNEDLNDQGTTLLFILHVKLLKNHCYDLSQPFNSK